MAELSKAIAQLMQQRGTASTDALPLRALLDRLRAMVPPRERALADAFTRQLLGKTEAELLAAADPQMWAALAVDAFRFVSMPTRPEPRVRVFNPTITRDGWDSADTIVQSNLQDRPFIVETIRECVQAEAGPVHRLLHPIFAVERDRSGVLQHIGPPAAVGRNESFVHTEIARVADPPALQAALTARLTEVMAATDDYQPMRARIAVYAEALRTRSIPRPWNEDVGEVAALLEWLAKKSFVFLGYREYEFTGQGTERRVSVRRGTGLGILRDESRSSCATARPLPEALRRRLNEPPLLLVSKTNAESPIHRRAHMDYIGLKQIDPSGVVIGEYRFLGLLTAKAYGEESAQVPLLRRKLEAILAAAEAVPESHDYRTIVELFNTIPKEELFGSAAAELGSEIAAMRAAEGTHRLHVACRPDALGRGMFVVVMLPRDQFSADLERRIEQQLQHVLNGLLLHQHTALDNFERVRLHFYFAADAAVQRSMTAEHLEAELAELLRTWEDRLTERLGRDLPAAAAQQLVARYLPAFSDAYRAATDIPPAVRDIRCMEALRITRTPQVDITNETGASAARFTAVKLYVVDDAVILSAVLPLLENLGLTVYEEDHLDVPLPEIGAVRIHTFLVQDRSGARLDTEQVAVRLSAAILALRAGQAENDALNQLVLRGGLTWREVDLLRAYMGHAQQAQVAARELLIEALATHPEPARLLFEGFRAKFDPALNLAPRERAATLLPPVEALFLASLDAVESVLHDRILRALWATLSVTVRTNFYTAPAPAGTPARAGEGTIAIKLDSARLPHLPRPHPRCEIYVHAPHMSGIHLRSSQVARGGIRLSDRPDDFRTEVLGLMKTQTVKNAVIVPGGAKGGLVVKHPFAGAPPSTIAAYRALIGGLLDLTDNVVHGGAVPPAELLIYDDADPYLVVAADKGTATFSDTANEIAAGYGFWLGDAFASGGSHGYDHKREAITAQGAWESVRQHFRALARDADSEPLTVIGIGDMSGDVFGNGLLRSRHLRLRAAFNHAHVFLDPDPDPLASFAERERLFALPRSGWNDYNPQLLSPGGGIFARTAKRIALSPAVRAMLGVEAEALSGEELIQAILRMDADLLWNGGIGTYVKARDETHAEVGDSANDAVRVGAHELRVKVIGEGGNLGLTQRARVEYALAGGAVNSDAIDNSAGVDLSDHEVNLKIALGRAIDTDVLTVGARNELLAQLTAEVCAQVLADNRRQARALTIDQRRSRARLNEFRDLTALLEAEAQLDRQLERLPDRDAQRARRATFLGLTRPELAVLLAYSKLHLQHVLLQSSLPDDPFLERFLRRYFPAVVNDRYGDGVRSHRLRREIIAVTLGNWLIDAMGMTFAPRIARDTGADVVTVVKAWTSVVAVTGAEEIIDRVLTGAPPLAAAADEECAAVLEDSFERAVKWVIETQPTDFAIDDWVKGFVMAVGALQYGVNEWLSEGDKQRERAVLDRLLGAGTPPSLAQPLIALRRTADLLEIDQIASELEAPLELAGEVYYRSGELLDFEWLRESLRAAAARALDTRWERRALEGLAEGLVYARRRLTRAILISGAEGRDVAHCLAAFVEPHTAQLAKLHRLIDDVKSAREPTLAALVVVMRELGRLAGS